MGIEHSQFEPRLRPAVVAGIGALEAIATRSHTFEMDAGRQDHAIEFTREHPGFERHLAWSLAIAGAGERAELIGAFKGVGRADGDGSG
ncbi:unannotated protein [freshwater metagenome]|uniref:Unannotated protein n=1 Tax=freshwater metagenome TaxID=449393 RepID=A0A6J5YDQ0_9ZZZZ